MDFKHPRPRRNFASVQNREVSQRPSFENVPAIEAPRPNTLPQYAGSAVFESHDAQTEQAVFEEAQTATMPAVIAEGIRNTYDEFASHAKAYKHEQLLINIYHGMFKGAVILAVIVALLGGVGVLVNAKYSGRALPFAKIGDVSVGGLTKPQIVELLQTTSKDLTISFQDGALTKTVPAATFNPKYDFEQVASEAVVSHLNPYSFIDRTSTQAKVTINSLQVDGYLRQYITNTQTRSEDAYLQKGTDKVTVHPEVVGFSANSHHIARQISWALANMSDAKIKISTAAVKPNIYSADLQPEADRANGLINTKVSVRYAGNNATPTTKQKADWMTISRMPGSNTYSYDFSKEKIREYVVGLAQKYQKPVTIKQTEDTENPVGYTVPTVVLTNVEEVTDQIYQALKTGSSTVAVFTKDDSIKNRIPAVATESVPASKPTAVAPATTNPPKQLAQNP